MSLLTKFYQDIQAWIDAGLPAVNPHGFRIYRGLCVNLTRWYTKLGVPDEECHALDKELEHRFLAAGLDDWYPFNEGVRESFMRECDEGTVFQNPKRLEWIKNHAISQQPQ